MIRVLAASRWAKVVAAQPGVRGPHCANKVGAPHSFLCCRARSTPGSVWNASNKVYKIYPLKTIFVHIRRLPVAIRIPLYPVDRSSRRLH